MKIPAWIVVLPLFALLPGPLIWLANIFVTGTIPMVGEVIIITISWVVGVVFTIAAFVERGKIEIPRIRVDRT